MKLKIENKSIPLGLDNIDLKALSWIYKKVIRIIGN
jgi:hypothetical protein